MPSYGHGAKKAEKRSTNRSRLPRSKNHTPASLLLRSRFSFEGPGQPLQPCEGPFLEVCPQSWLPSIPWSCGGGCSVSQGDPICPSTLGASTCVLLLRMTPMRFWSLPRTFVWTPAHCARSTFRRFPPPYASQDFHVGLVPTHTTLWS